MNTTNADDFVLKELARLRADLAANHAQLKANESQQKTTQRRLKATWAAGFALFGGLGLAASPTAQARFGMTLTSLNARLTAVEAKTLTLSWNESSELVTISGVNVRIVEVSGATSSDSRLRNLQLGYDETRAVPPNVRTGTHHLILGRGQNDSSYSGILAGFTNTISAPFCSVLAGELNIEATFSRL